MSKPKTWKPELGKQDAARLAKLKLKDELNETEQESLQKILNRVEFIKDPPLSKAAMDFLANRYAWEKYGKRTAATGFGFSAVSKGNSLEAESIKMLSNFDGIEYVKNDQIIESIYLRGKCDIVCKEEGKIIDVKTSWNINTFLENVNSPLERNYWFQMQGYLELYDFDYGEVCFCLLNTPFDLVERERAKLMMKYMFGEITRESYNDQYERLEMAFCCEKIPMRRRIIRYRVDRHKAFIPELYYRIGKCRQWLADFERIHMANKNIVTLADKYVNSKEDNSESDSEDARSFD